MHFPPDPSTSQFIFFGILAIAVLCLIARSRSMAIGFICTPPGFALLAFIVLSAPGSHGNWNTLFAMFFGAIGVIAGPVAALIGKGGSLVAMKTPGQRPRAVQSDNAAEPGSESTPQFESESTPSD